MPDRPAGKKSESSSGVDHVVEPPADDDEDGAVEPTDDAPREETFDEDTIGEEGRVGDDLLDARERRQSTVRKPAGPSDSRVEPNDVVIEVSVVPPAPPTEPA